MLPPIARGETAQPDNDVHRWLDTARPTQKMYPRCSRCLRLFLCFLWRPRGRALKNTTALKTCRRKPHRNDEAFRVAAALPCVVDGVKPEKLRRWESSPGQRETVFFVVGPRSKPHLFTEGPFRKQG